MMETSDMSNAEIAARLRQIIHFSNEVWDASGHLDFATNHARTLSNLTELLLDIIKAPKI